MTCGWNMFYADTSCDTVSHHVMCAQGWKCRERVSSEGGRSTPPVGNSGSLSTVNETTCNKKREIWAEWDYELTYNSIQMRTTTRNLLMKANIPILYVGQLERWRGDLRRKFLVLVVFVVVVLDGWAVQLIGSPDSWCKRFFIKTAAL